jgi:hypothetical protein
MTPEANSKKISPRKAIAAHCKGCLYDKAAPGTWRQQVEECTIKTCELYEFRPQRKDKTNKAGLTEHCHGASDESQRGGL